MKKADLKELFVTHMSLVLEDSEVEILIAIEELGNYEKGEVLFEAKDPGDSVYMISSDAWIYYYC